MTTTEEEAPKAASDESSDGGKLTTVGVFLIIGGLFMAISGAVSLVQAKASSKWSSVPGRIISAEVGGSVDEHASAFSGKKKESHRYRAEVRYEYTVDGESFTGDKVSRFDLEYPRAEQAEEIVARYEVGETVDVFHDPDDPAMAILDVSGAQHAKMLLGLGALCLGVGGLMAIGGRF